MMAFMENTNFRRAGNTFMTKRNSGMKRKVLYFISSIILISLFNQFIWEKYFFNPTPWDALEEEKGQPGVMGEIDRDNYIAFLHPDKGFKVYALSRGFWGWSITDDIAIPNEDTTEPFIATVKTLQLKGKDNVDIILIVSHDKNIRAFTATDENGKKFNFNGTVNDESSTYLYYQFEKDTISENLTIEAYSKDDELLYKEEIK